MTTEEIKAQLLEMELPSGVMLGQHMKIVDPMQFIKTQLIEIENWKKDLDKCPAYLRLVDFHNAVKQK